MSAIEAEIPTIRDVGLRIIKGHFSGSPETLRAYLFPSQDQVRIIEVHPDSPKSDTGEIVPFYFWPIPEQGVPYTTGIVLVSPEEERHLSLPNGWGSWDDAEVIQPER